MRPYTLKQLQTFLEVARQRSVSKAAERLFVTQPAVSMQIRQLEDAFGLALLEPVGRNIRLTHAGEAFLLHAQAAMGQLKDLEAQLPEPLFCRVHHGFIVNLANIERDEITKSTRLIYLHNGTEIPISIQKAEQFGRKMEAFLQ